VSAADPGTGRWPDARRAIAISVNGRRFAPQRLVEGWGTYDWEIDAAAWREGLNDLVVHSPAPARAASAPPGARAPGLGVREIDFAIRE
jgi:hypothetical protein